jgi:hypothetical protein
MSCDCCWRRRLLYLRRQEKGKQRSGNGGVVMMNGWLVEKCVKVGEGSDQEVVGRFDVDNRMLVERQCWCRVGYGKWV